jgi:plasmid stability protein
VERVSFEIERQEVADALHAEAAAHGRSVAAEVAALVEKGLAGKVKLAKSSAEGNWVQELIELGKGLDLPGGIESLIPHRLPENYEPPEL